MILPIAMGTVDVHGDVLSTLLNDDESHRRTNPMKHLSMNACRSSITCLKYSFNILIGDNPRPNLMLAYSDPSKIHV